MLYPFHPLNDTEQADDQEQNPWTIGRPAGAWHPSLGARP